MRGGYRIRASQRSGSFAEEGGEQSRPPVFTHPALTVWSGEPVLSLGDHGCIIGHLFTQSLPSRRVERLDSTAIDRLLASGGRSLLADYWGGYLLALVSPDGSVAIMRDPSGLMPCYLRRADGVAMLADDITALAAPGTASVNPDEITRYLASGDAPGRATCVEGVEELIAGECLRVEQSRVTIESWWSPWDFVKCPKNVDFADVAAQLRAIALDCIGTWADCFDDILLGVSGGLDSSIVAVGAHGRTNMTCLTLVGPDAEGDERGYARQLTDALGLSLVDARYDLADIDVARAVSPHHPRPNASYFRQAIGAIHGQIETERPVDAHFSGNGGDGIFCSLRSALPLIDRFLAEGPRPALVVTLRDLCDLTGADGMTVLRYAWRKYRDRGDRYRPKYNPLGLRAEPLAKIEAAGSLHPWLAAPPGALPGKMAHVAFLMRAQRSLELYPRGSAPPHVAPLLSQPIVELCLSIPTWFWIDGGRNRAVARSAFEELLPAMLLQRTHKGGPGGFSRAIYDRWCADLRDRLRHGRLASLGILDPTFLDGPDDPAGRDAARWSRILTFGVAEAWMQWWADD